jgi:NAD(P)-dependent dehydrogenase (short-subunit alcohol dehydrogenase family)
LVLNPLEMSGRTILVTGGSSGIGLASALLLSRLGARILLLARDRERLELAREQLEGVNHHIYSVDLEDVAAIPNVMRAIKAEVGRLSSVVHAAGVHSAMPLPFTSLADSKRMMDINFHAGVELTRAFCQKEVLMPPASLVFISSVVAHVGQSAVSLYAATKGAMSAFSKSLAVELAGRKICVNCVAAGMVQTPLTDRLFRTLSGPQRATIEKKHLLGIGSPDDVALAVAYLLASPWVTGSTMFVDGGYTAH